MRSSSRTFSTTSIYCGSTCSASRTSTQKEAFPRSEFTLALNLDTLDACRSPNAVRVHAGTKWISKLTACHLQILHRTRRSFDHHGEGNGNFVKKSFEKWKKWSLFISLIDLKVMKMRCDIACDCVKRANVVLGLPYCYFYLRVQTFAVLGFRRFCGYRY